MAPGKLISIFGTDLGPAQGVTTSYDLVLNRLPTSAQGASVTINGRGSPVLYARADQINAQVPYELTGSEATIVVAYNGVTGSSARLPADATQPAGRVDAWRSSRRSMRIAGAWPIVPAARDSPGLFRWSGRNAAGLISP